jgi:uncharacterized protein YlxW (UPF0749 family)
MENENLQKYQEKLELIKIHFDIDYLYSTVFEYEREVEKILDLHNLDKLDNKKIRNLKSEIEDLENEIDDLETEIAKLKKQLKK